jgi:hypothetical protein
MPLKADLKGTHCVLYGKYSFCKKPFSRLRVSGPKRRFFAWGIKNSSCGHTALGLLGKDFGQGFSGFERDDLDENVCFWSFFLLGPAFISSAANTLICTRQSATF